MNTVTDGGGGRVVVDDQRKCSVEKKEGINLLTETITDYVTLDSVWVVKEISKNVISIGKRLRDGLIFEGFWSSIRINVNGVSLVLEKNEGNGLYYTKLQRMNLVATDYYHKVTKTDNDNE